MKMLPGMTVICLADYNQTKQATLAMLADYEGPVYLRFGRPKWPILFPENLPFEIGKAQVLTEGTDITLIATGHMVWLALQAAEALKSRRHFGGGHQCAHHQTVGRRNDPRVMYAKQSKAVTCEEHNVIGGLGESVASVLARRHPPRLRWCCVNDTFGESGTPDQLLKYGLSALRIKEAAQKLLKTT